MIRAAKKTVYVFDQFKRPEESRLLRDVFGEFYSQISCHSNTTKRIKALTQKIIGDHPEDANVEKWQDVAKDLIRRDESEEEDEEFGQSVRESFPEADLILDATNESNIRKQIARFLRLAFGDPNISPTFEEYANNLAFQASYRSLDLSRQVGAAIFDSNRKVLALGCNEVPKVGGGTCWEDDSADTRDFRVGYDINAVKKRGLVIDVVKKLKRRNLLAEEIAKLPDDKLEVELIGKAGAALEKAEILEILEYGRALHAEMNAITDAAAARGQIKDATLFCTTFPCHNCAKHIVGAGVKNVYYLQPYPKSKVWELYPDSIAVDDGHQEQKVCFHQFIGVTSRRFNLFSRNKKKHVSGKLIKWETKAATPNLRMITVSYFDSEKRAIKHVTSKLKGRLSTALGCD